jgi:alpha-mannosidase
LRLDESKQDLLWRKVLRRKDEIAGYVVSNRTPITDITIFETRDYLTYAKAVRAKFRPFKVGEGWGRGGSNAWFRIAFTVPREFKGRLVTSFFKFGKVRDEACLFLDGKPFAGLDRFHEEVHLLQEAKGGETFEFVVDARAGAPWDPEGTDTEYSNEQAVLERAEIATVNQEVRQYWYDLDVLHLLAERLPKDSVRRARIIYGLNKSVDAFDYDHTDDASLAKSAIAAREILRPLMECPAEASALEFTVVGHSHIDSAWRWPFKESVRKCSRTFSTQMRIMEEYPEFVYTQGQALLYSFVKEHYPGLYEDIKKRVKEGRWDVTGSFWVEADCNLSSGESLVRQILVGKNFYRDEFGIDSNVLWLPDVFGYSAALPQILKKSGVDYFMTNKIHWNDTNKPPYGTFHWKGIDGSCVLAHFPPSPSYNSFPAPEWTLDRYPKLWQDKDRANDILFTYGWGDGGGGPEYRHLEYIRREQNLEGYPRMVHRTVPQFFRHIDNGTDYHEWAGELYLEFHRGTYTTQGKIKRQNRKAEMLYRDAELLSSIASPLGLPYPQDELNREWKQILAHQFHDVIPGTSVQYVYQQADEAYAGVFATGEKTVNTALNRIAKRIDTSGTGEAIVVFNTLPWDRSDIARIRLSASDPLALSSPGSWAYRSAVARRPSFDTLRYSGLAEVDSQKADFAVLDANGVGVPSQISDGELFFNARVPSMGYATYRLVKMPSSQKTSIKASKSELENRFYRIKLDAKGLIKSLVLKSNGREMLPEGARANLLQMFEDKPTNWPAWEIEFHHEDKFQDITQLDSLTVVECGPVFAAVEMERSFSRSKLRQRMVVYADSPRIDFETWIDWHENEKLLKVAFPVDVNSTTARYEIQFGNVERPTHRNTSWDFARFEVCAHRWADFSEAGFGMSLMNDCKYGHSVKDNVMRLSLLRSAKKPDPTADMGEHVFTYSIMPHEGSYVEAETVRRAYELNAPVRTILAEPHPGKLPTVQSFFSVDSPNVVLETVKRAEKDDATILRLYECHNRRGRVTVKANVPFSRVRECDLMEQPIADVPSDNGSFSFEIKPFEIRTFRLEQT